MRRIRWRQNKGLWAAQALVALFRVLFRTREATLPEQKRTRLRRLRQKLDAMDHDRDILRDRMKNEKGWGKFDALDEFMERHADARTLENQKPHQEKMRLMRQESEDLQAIRQHTDGNLVSAVTGYQEYVTGHPESHSGYSYLGGVLKQIGDLEGSLTAYREAIRLAGDSPVPAGSARLSVAVVLHSLGRTDAAIAELHSLIDMAGVQNECIVCLAYDRLGDILMDAQDRKAARQAWKQAMKWDTTQIVARRVREKIQSSR